MAVYLFSNEIEPRARTWRSVENKAPVPRANAPYFGLAVFRTEHAMLSPPVLALGSNLY